MALDWCNHVDGKNIWPTLPVYLRVYHSKWQKGHQAKDALRHAKSAVEALNGLIQLSNRRIAADMQSRNPQSTGAAIPITQAEDIVPPTTNSHGPMVVDLHTIGGAPTPSSAERASRIGKRGRDKKRRKARHCVFCRRRRCPGTSNRKRCRHKQPDARSQPRPAVRGVRFDSSRSAPGAILHPSCRSPNVMYRYSYSVT